ncbi:hypothetical protein K4K59_004322 [Colletotrichum sp. SAR11_240]|nr:hypothetical protein K4K59_004322 [Colletotrichum sp. SAR11_240]
MVDSYFEDETDAEDPFMLASYVKADDEYSEDLDPISVGELTAGKESIKDPREYFLLVSAVRVKRHLEEWTNIRSKLRSRIHGYLSDPHIPLRRRNTNLGTADMDNANVEDSEAWVKQASNQLTILSNKLCKTVDRTKRFVSHGWEDIDVQADEDTSRRIRECLCDISGSIEEMEDVVDGFNDLKSRVKTFEDHLGIHIAVDGGRAIKLQHINVTILQVFSPLALAGTIIQAGIVVGNVYISYAVLTAILFIVTLNLQKTIKCEFVSTHLDVAVNGIK